MPHAPSLFIGSSSEALSVAEAIERNLKRESNLIVRLWKKEGIFLPGQFLPERLLELATTHDFAALVFSPDDVVISRGVKGFAPRDNIVFELGLFAGTLGHERTFAVISSDDKPKLPVDFLGVTYATYTMNEKDMTGALVPSVEEACDQIRDAVRQQGNLRHPRFEPALSEITHNVRRAFRVEHPLFLNHFERWCNEEKDASSHFGRGLLRISTDYGSFLTTAFRSAEKNIFSTSGPAMQQLWNQDMGRWLLETQRKNSQAPSSRVFIYRDSRDVSPTDINIMKLHQKYDVEVRVHVDSSDRFFNFDPGKTENQFDIIDDGRAIGIMKSIGPDKREAYWYFDDPDITRDFVGLRDTLMLTSPPLDEWLVQQPKVA